MKLFYSTRIVSPFPITALYLFLNAFAKLCLNFRITKNPLIIYEFTSDFNDFLICQQDYYPVCCL